MERVRVYRPPLWMNTSLAACGLAVLLLSVWALITGYEADQWFAFVGFAVAGFSLLVALYFEKLELTESTLRYGFRTVARADIVGFRKSPFRIVVRSGKPLAIRSPYRVDAAFEAFFAGVPDLDAADQNAAVAAFLRSDVFGTTDAERRATHERFRRVAWGFNAVTAALIVASFVWPWILGPLALLPFVGLAVFLAGRGRWALDRALRDGLPELRPVFAAPLVYAPLALSLHPYRALIHLVEYPPFLLVGALVGLVAGLLVHRSDAKPRRGSTALVGLAFAVGFASTLALVNARCDDHLPEQHRVAIVRSLCDSNGARLELESWGPIAERDLYTVYRDECARYTADCAGTPGPSPCSAGEAPAALRDVVGAHACEACIALHPGALGLAWYEIDPCAP